MCSFCFKLELTYICFLSVNLVRVELILKVKQFTAIKGLEIIVTILHYLVLKAFYKKSWKANRRKYACLLCNRLAHLKSFENQVAAE